MDNWSLQKGSHHLKQLKDALTRGTVIKGMADNLREAFVHVSYLLLKLFIVSNEFLGQISSSCMTDQLILSNNQTYCIGCVKGIIPSRLEGIGQLHKFIVHLDNLITEVLTSDPSKVHLFQSQER